MGSELIKNYYQELSVAVHKGIPDFYVDGGTSIKIVTNVQEFRSMFHTTSSLLGFGPHPGWRGYVELG